MVVIRYGMARNIPAIGNPRTSPFKPSAGIDWPYFVRLGDLERCPLDPFRVHGSSAEIGMRQDPLVKRGGG